MSINKKTLALLTTGVSASALLAATNPGSIKWNVMVLMTDMQNVHYLGVDHQSKENIQTPNMDRIGLEGMIFGKAYDAVPVSAPTRASLLTGAYPMKHLQTGNDTYLVEAGPQGKTPSLAHVFRDNGYNTAMFGKQHSNLEPLENLPNGTFGGKNVFVGWDYRRYVTSLFTERLDTTRFPDRNITKAEYELGIAERSKMSVGLDDYKNSLLARFPEEVGTAQPQWEKDMVANNKGTYYGATPLKTAYTYSDAAFVYESLDYLETFAGKRNDSQFGIDKKKPLFMFVSLHKPHHPWTAPLMHDGTEWWYMYSARPEEDGLTYLKNGKPMPRIIPSPMIDSLIFEDPSSPYYGTETNYSDEAIRMCRAKYSANISWLDHLFGKVLDKLAVLDDPNNPGKKMIETTIICFTSDHGDMVGQKKRTGKMVAYEGSARVPFLLRMPGVIKPGQRSDILVNHVDMFPTLAGLAGLGNKLNTQVLDGKDLSKAILKNDPKMGPERTFTVASPKLGSLPGQIYSRTQRYKFIRVESAAKRVSYNLPVMMLFDMDKDPYETNNLAYNPKYVDVVITENNACNAFLAKYGIEEVKLTAEMLKGKTKEQLVNPKGGQENPEKAKAKKAKK